MPATLTTGWTVAVQTHGARTGDHRAQDRLPREGGDVATTTLRLGVRAQSAQRAWTHAAFVAGHSVGAFAVAVTVWVLTFLDAFAAVRLRGNLMEGSAGAGPWGVAALLGLPVPAGRAVVARRGRHRPGALDRLSGTATALDHAAPPPIALSRGDESGG